MNYQIEFKPRSLKDLRSIDQTIAKRILEKIRLLENDLAGDVKKLTNHLPNTDCELVIIGSFSRLKRIKLSSTESNIVGRHINIYDNGRFAS